MRPFPVVVAEKLRYFPLPGSQGPGNTIEAFSLEGLDEPFDVAVVSRFPDPAVAVKDATVFDDLGEPLGKLRTVIGLDCLEPERSGFLGLLDEGSAQPAVGLDHRPGVSPAGTDVNQGVGRESVPGLTIEHGVYFNENTRALGQRPGRILVPLLPPREPRTIVSSEHPFDAGEADNDTFFEQPVVQDLGALISLLPYLENPVNHCLGQGSRMVKRTARACGDDQAAILAVFWLPSRPLNNRALGEAKVSSHSAGAPAMIVHQAVRLVADLFDPRVGDVSHILHGSRWVITRY